MKKIIILFLIIITGTSKLLVAFPDEGMWLPLFLNRLNYEDMQKKGLRLTQEELWSINNSSLKDAIVMLDGGSCTAEIISSEGLVLTNHHCGYDAIQQHSSVEKDYLSNGFWAYDKKDELKNEGMTASLLLRIEDVTEKILSKLDDSMTETERKNAIQEEGAKLAETAEENGKYEAGVSSFFEGNEFYLFVYITYKDIRLVGAPPSSIGKFGGDVDNWMWPRHTGDFCLFRIYTSADGEPADYSENNVPLKPKHHLPISIKPKKENDYAMIWGYPGQTQRYLTSAGVKVLLEQTAPSTIKLRDKKLTLMKEDMDANPEIRIKYASKYSSTSNYWKYYIGQSKGIKRLDVIEKKKAAEEKFNDWANLSDNKERYGNVIRDLNLSYGEIEKNLYETRQKYLEEILMGSEILLFGFQLQNMGIYSAIEQDKENREGALTSIREFSTKFYKDYNKETDRKIFAGLMEMMSKDIPEVYQPEIFKEIKKKYRNDFNKFSRDVYDKSVLSTEENFNKFLSKPKSKKLKKDPIMEVMSAMIGAYIELSALKVDVNIELRKAKRLYLEGLRKMESDKKFYPDANSTMRVTYGTVGSYIPSDAVKYDYQTTIKGIIEKEDSLDPEFVVPLKLRHLYKYKDFGQYGEDGKMMICFIANTDITGGNSGSPVLNGSGELIGLAFDGNWEAMSGDIAYEPELQRTICVDIRYVLFIIDKFAGAKNIIKELDIKI